MPALCRDCLTTFETGRRCPACGRPRIVAHPELFDLTIAHLDCDAFYASVEKRDDPSLRDQPVIIGGGRRGVVSTACYIARIKGVRSAMPMFQALKLCPEAVVVRGRMDRYVEVSRQVRAMMDDLTPIVEPLSLDEAFLDLAGTQRLHHAPPAVMLARLARRMEEELGITGSIGLSHNKFLAKVASDLDKPRGFSVIGRAETAAFLRDRPVRLIWGVGEVGQAALEANEPVRGISNETTFHEDTADPEILDGHIWRLSEKVADRAKAKGIAGRVVTLKLKRADHSLITRRISLRDPTQIADRVYRAARGLFDQLNGGPYRLLGVGLSELRPESEADPSGDLLDPEAARRAGAERAVDRVRAKFGAGAILKGRALR